MIIVDPLVVSHLLEVSWGLLEGVGVARELSHPRAHLGWGSIPEILVDHSLTHCICYFSSRLEC